MCGIVGFTGQSGSEPGLVDLINPMTEALTHRGPDAGGVWVDSRSGTALGHRRLAILDTGPSGNQPMISASGRFVVTYNGEIYNFRELRGQLEAQDDPRFRGAGDTEVLVAAIDRWGLMPAVERLIGMFALGVWDTTERALHLVRDRVGIKPLYHARAAGAVLFASDLAALERHPGFDRTLDPTALDRLLRHSSIPAPRSIYTHAAKVPPGSCLTFRGDRETLTHYWSAAGTVRTSREHPFTGSPEEAIEVTESLLRDAVSSRRVSDVPLGAFLSGGIDSKTWSWRSCRNSRRPGCAPSPSGSRTPATTSPHRPAGPPSGWGHDTRNSGSAMPIFWR